MLDSANEGDPPGGEVMIECVTQNSDVKVAFWQKYPLIKVKATNENRYAAFVNAILLVLGFL